MFLWELIARRLRAEGWSLWHSACRDACGETYVVHLHRPGTEWTAFAPTLSEAFAEAARQARHSAGGGGAAMA